MPAGIDGGIVRPIELDSLIAWVGTVTERSIGPTLDRVRAHDAVAAAALATGATPLPMRFAQTFDTDEDCIVSLGAEAPRLVADLERLRGMVEMRVIIALAPHAVADDPESAGSPGRAYMERLMKNRGADRTVHNTAAVVRERLSTVLAPYARDESVTVATSPHPVVTLVHLVAREAASAYRESVEAVRFEGGVERVVVGGPFAPFQFVSPPT